MQSSKEQQGEIKRKEKKKLSSVIKAKKLKKKKKKRMGKTRDLFRNIRDTKGTFHEKMGTIKDRNGMDLTEMVWT